MHRLAIACLPLILAFCVVICGCAAPERDLATYAIVGATLIDGTALPPVDNAVLVVENGKIAAMGPVSEVHIPGDAKRINGRRRFIFPRIIDQPLIVEGPADLILCDVNPARDPDYLKKTAGRMEKGRWTQFPN